MMTSGDINPHRSDTFITSRIAGMLLMDQGRLCRTKNFRGHYFYTEKFIDLSHFDELIFLNVTRPRADNNQRKFLGAVENLTAKTLLPVTLGGGINSPVDVASFFKAGADRLLIDPSRSGGGEVIRTSVENYGSQAVIGALNIVSDHQSWKVVDSELNESGMSLRKHVELCQALGVGELLLNSVTRDGALSGLDLLALHEVVSCTDLPVVVTGGAGNWMHLADGLLKGGASGVASANIYHLSSESILSAKRFLREKGVSIRLEDEE